MDIIKDLMNFDSFWTLWFWIAHVVAWSMASHFTLGVPYDMVQEANREPGEDGPWARATEAMILAQSFRFASYARRFGPWLAGVSAFLLSVCITAGSFAGSETARALVTFFLPMILIYIGTIKCALRIEAEDLHGEALRGKVRRQRLINQMIGLFAILLATALAVYQAVLDTLIWGAG